MVIKSKFIYGNSLISINKDDVKDSMVIKSKLIYGNSFISVNKCDVKLFRSNKNKMLYTFNSNFYFVVGLLLMKPDVLFQYTFFMKFVNNYLHSIYWISCKNKYLAKKLV